MGGAERGEEGRGERERRLVQKGRGRRVQGDAVNEALAFVDERDDGLKASSEQVTAATIDTRVAVLHTTTQC